MDAVLWAGEGVGWDMRCGGLNDEEMAGCDEGESPGEAQSASQDARVIYDALRPRQSHSAFGNELRSRH